MAENPTAVADEMEEELQEPVEEQTTGGGKKWLLIILILLVLAGGAGGAAWYFLTSPQAEDQAAGETPPAPIKAKPHYLQLEPGFVVNLNDPDYMRYLQVDVQIMSYDDAVLSHIDEYMPEIRNRLLLLFAQQKYEQLIPRSGKEALQAQVLGEVNTVLGEHGVDESAAAVYFTSFVMQ